MKEEDREYLQESKRIHADCSLTDGPTCEPLRLLSIIDGLEAECEKERLRLAACGVAAMQNTEKTKAERITKENSYWSASYGDVCRAVDAEMDARQDASRLAAHLRRYKEECGRMRDDWAEGGSEVKRMLWVNVHALEDKAMELLAAHEKAGEPKDSNGGIDDGSRCKP